MSGARSQARENGAAAPRASRFKPPTIDEVRAYCLERGNLVDPERWHAHYTSNGWRVGKNPMRDWHAAVRTWEHNGNGYATAPGQAPAKEQLIAESLRLFRGDGKRQGRTIDAEVAQ